MGKLKTTRKRAELIWDVRAGKFTVLDSRYGTLVLYTENRGIAEYWASRVDICEHPFPYSITEHDSRVRQWELKGGKNG